jgi:hypothetical protein
MWRVWLLSPTQYAPQLLLLLCPQRCHLQGELDAPQTPQLTLRRKVNCGVCHTHTVCVCMSRCNEAGSGAAYMVVTV